jgi:hypothetical protein
MDYWHKQTTQPLFGELIWDKPENRQLAGKLLIIGGNAYSFAAPASAFEAAQNAGVGSVKVLLPDALKKSVGAILENGEYGPSTKSGSFSKTALAEWIDYANWSDGVLLPGDLGRNSETAIALEHFIKKYSGLITVTHDALDYFTSDSVKLLERSNTVIVCSFAQLQKMTISARFVHPLTFDMPIANIVENLHILTTIYPVAIVCRHNGIFFVSHDGEVSTTITNDTEGVWRVVTAARASVWTIQNPSKIFAALTCSVFNQR